MSALRLVRALVFTLGGALAACGGKVAETSPAWGAAGSSSVVVTTGGFGGAHMFPPGGECADAGGTCIPPEKGATSGCPLAIVDISDLPCGDGLVCCNLDPLGPVGSAGAGAGGSAPVPPAGGAGGSAPTTTDDSNEIANQLFDDSAEGTACKACIRAMVGPAKNESGQTFDCSTVEIACGSNDENCMSAVSCIEDTLSDDENDTLDCVVSICVPPGNPADGFFACVRSLCPEHCGFTGELGCPD